jgi:two-component system, NtrC family, response regulator
MKPKLLIVDDDDEIRTQMKWALGKDYEVLLAGERDGALEAFNQHRPAVVILDLGLPPCPNEPDEGMAILSEVVAGDRTTKVIIISGQEEKENALRAVGSGAFDFLSKPVNVEELALLLRRCFYVTDLEREHHALQQSLGVGGFEGMLGVSPSMQNVFAAIRKVATSSVPVLLLGESGTGKEMAAQAIHRSSPRKDAPFSAINCNAIPDTLLESELFGHEKGAFTGAHLQRKGLIERAANGTLLLDEIGELPLSLQVKLLRFLQEQTFIRVGGREEIHCDARVITATNSDLRQAIVQGKFREDLYFRLAVVVIDLPPLRQRGDDVVFMAKEFLRRVASEAGKAWLTFTADALTSIRRHPWPGNVRELQNRIQRAVIMTEGKRITKADMELADSPNCHSATLREARAQVEKEMIQQALRRNAGKISTTASDLGVSRPTLYELMEKLNIAKE